MRAVTWILLGALLLVLVASVLANAWSVKMFETDDNKAPPPLLPHIKAPVVSLPIMAHGSGAVLPTVEAPQLPAAPPAPDTSTHDQLPVITPAPGLGDSMTIDRAWIYDYLERTEAERVAVAAAQARDSLIARMTAYMVSKNHVQGLIDLVPLMVQLGEETGNDSRLCPVTANEESSGGRVCCGDFNPFGIGGNMGQDFPSWEAVVRYYFSQITSYGCNGDVWRIAFIWYDASDPDGRATSYANNVTGAVKGI